MNTEPQNKYDLTRGGILNKLLLVALPIMGTQLLVMSYNLVDMFLLGMVGSDAVAASGTAGMYLWLSAGFMLLGRMGAEIGVAQRMGRKDKADARRFAQNSVIVATAAGLFFTIVCLLFSRQLIGFFNIKEINVAVDAQNYLLITSVGIIPTFIGNALAGAFNGSGNSRVPFALNAAGLVANIILDPIFIFVLDMGVAGAAIATVIAQSMVCLLILCAIQMKRYRPFEHRGYIVKPSKKHIKQILRWSAPISAESLAFCFLVMIITRFVAEFGAGALAVQRVGVQIESLVWLVSGGFSTALTAFVGQNFGAGRWRRVHASCRVALITICLWGIAMTIVLFAASAPLVRIFLRDPQLIQIGSLYLKILAVSQIFSCLEAVGSGAFRGIGHTIKPSVVSIVSNILRVVLIYFLAKTSLGLNGVWVGISAGAILRGAWMYAWLRAVFNKLPRKNIRPADIVKNSQAQ